MRLFASVFVVVLAVAASLRAENQSAPPAKGQKVGVVNMNRLFKNFDYANRMGEEILKAAAAAEVKAKDKQTRLAEVAKESYEEKDSSRRLELQKEAIHLQQELQESMVSQQKEFADRQEKMALEVYRQIRRTVAELAKERGYELILTYFGPYSDADIDSPQLARQAMTSGSSVPLYAAREHDLTDDVLERLNKKNPIKTK